MRRTPRHSTKPRARIQVLKCADEILKRRAQGESFTDIHSDLQDRAEVDVSLRVFTLWVGRLEDGTLLNAAPPEPAQSACTVGNRTESQHPEPVERTSAKRSPPPIATAGIPRSAPVKTQPNPDELY